MKEGTTFDDLRKRYEALSTAELTSEIARLSVVVEASRKPGVVGWTLHTSKRDF